MTGRWPVLALCLICGLASGAGGQVPDSRSRDSRDEVVARVGERAITMAEVDRRWAAEHAASWAQVRQETYDARWRVLEGMIGEYLIDAEAAARGVSRERLLEVELARRIRPVTGEEIASFYRSLGQRASGATLEQLTPAIRQLLEEQRPIQARQSLIDDLRSASTSVRTMLEPPRLQVTTAATDPVFGPAGAPVEIVEFSDFQCPFCARVQPALQKLRAAFPNRIRFVFKDLPLPMHAEAFAAAEAAQCAHEQGKFWEYRDVLFAHQEALGREDLKRYAATLKLDTARFNTCLNEDRFKHLVQADIDESERYGASSTPAFFINGRLLNGAQPYEAFERIVREELALKAAAAPGGTRRGP